MWHTNRLRAFRAIFLRFAPLAATRATACVAALLAVAPTRGAEFFASNAAQITTALAERKLATS